MVGRGSRQTDRRVKGLQVRQKGRGGERRKRRRRKMSAVAFVAPSRDVMFATSLGLSGHPSPLPPPSIQCCSSLLVSLSLHTFQLSISHVRYYQRLHSAWPVNQPALCPQGVLGSPEVWLTLTRRRFCPKASLFLQLLSLFLF